SLFRSNDWIDFEVDDVAPIRNPFVEITDVRCLHQLKASFELFIDPARYVLQSFWRQAAVFSEALVHRNRIAVLKMFDNHVKQSRPSGRVQYNYTLMVQHTRHRFRKNVPGPFYTTGDCLACDAPEH